MLHPYYLVSCFITYMQIRFMVQKQCQQKNIQFFEEKSSNYCAYLILSQEYQQSKMQIDKISLIKSLKKLQKSIHLKLEHVLVVLSLKELSLPQVRAFITHINRSPQEQWRNSPIDNLKNMSDEACKFTSNNKQKQNEAKRQYEKNVTKSDELRKNIFVTQQEKLMTNKELYAKILQMKKQNNAKKTNLSTSEQMLIQKQSQIRELENLLQKITFFETQQSKLTSDHDQQSNLLIQQILSQLGNNLNGSTIPHQISQKSLLQSQVDAYQRRLKKIKKRVRQIYQYYCKENDINGYTFQDYTKAANLLDLRLYLKYFKQFDFQSINKYRYRTSIVSQYFRSEATNGLALDFDQFWAIHKKIFLIYDHTISKRQVIQSQKASFEVIKQKIIQQTEKLQQLQDIISSQKGPERVKFSLRTEQQSSPTANKLKSTTSQSKITLSSRSNSLKVRQNSQRGNIFGRQKNFIGQVRQQLQKSQRGQSQSTQSIKFNRVSTIQLPKILKLTEKQVQSKGIYQSLKKFAHYQFLAQEKKIRSIIGLSAQQDEDYINNLLNQQSSLKLKQRQQSQVDRDKKRKLMIALTNKESHCKKINPQQVRPYMRF